MSCRITTVSYTHLDVYKRQVVQRSRRQTSVDGGRATVEKNLSRMVAKERITQEEMDAAMARITGSTDISIIAEADLVIEAATEDMEAKKALFKELDELCKPDTIIATNTSALSITEIAAATNRPDKIIGMHFFNPVPMMKLIEIVKGLATSEETREKIIALCEEMCIRDRYFTAQSAIINFFSCFMLPTSKI